MEYESELRGRILTVKEVSRYVPYGVKHLQRLCAMKLLPASKLRRKWLVSGDGLLEMLRTGSIPPPEAESGGASASC